MIGLVDYAKSNGFWWFELRDPEAVLTLEECREISSYASKNDIEIGYAIQKGLLDEDYWLTFNKGVRNAAVFQGPGTFRTLACGHEYVTNPEKKGWTADEFELILSNARKAASIAKENGLQMVFENGLEAFNGKDSFYFGTTDLLRATDGLVGWQFDVANPFCGSRVHPSPGEVENALSTFKNRMYYIHLKSSVEGKPMPTLKENPISFDKVFYVMNENNIPYVAIELISQKETEQTEKNLDRSIKYLKKVGFI
ncbi:MAG: hypothetical protein MI975_05525, partial [Cytophagales bacterium]|nr:hypothetical protein [Cytophagales bacterium]